MCENYFPRTKGAHIAELERLTAHAGRMYEREIVIPGICDQVRAVRTPAAVDLDRPAARHAVRIGHDEPTAAPDDSSATATRRADLDDGVREEIGEIADTSAEAALEGLEDVHSACPPRSRGVTRIVCCVPARSTVTSIDAPSGMLASASRRSDGRPSGWPAIATSKSPSCRPATSAGSPSASETTMSATS